MQRLIQIESHFGDAKVFEADQQLPQLPSAYLDYVLPSNGGLTEDGFMHYFGPRGPVAHNLMAWNLPDLWRCHYELASHHFVIAENVFGGQFFFDRRGAVRMLDPIRGTMPTMASDFPMFLRIITECCGKLIAVADRFASGALRDRHPFQHISYIRSPLFGGSESDMDNLEWCNGLVNLRIAGQLWSQVKDLPPGTAIKRVDIDPVSMAVRLIM